MLYPSLSQSGTLVSEGQRLEDVLVMESLPPRSPIKALIELMKINEVSLAQSRCRFHPPLSRAFVQRAAHFFFLRLIK